MYSKIAIYAFSIKVDVTNVKIIIFNLKKNLNIINIILSRKAHAEKL